MNRRDLLAFVTGAGIGLAGCSGDRRGATDPAGTAERTGADTGTVGSPTPGQAGPSPDALVELYDFASELYRESEAGFEDGLGRYDTGEYVVAATEFAGARRGYADARGALTRVTDRLAELGAGGFRIADGARTRTDLLERAASNYVQAAVFTLEGEETTARDYRDSAETLRVRADNGTFEDPSAFESALRESL